MRRGDAPGAAAFRADPEDPRHGSINGYDNLACRCDRCTESKRVTHLAYMHTHPEQGKRQADRIRSVRKARVDAGLTAHGKPRKQPRKE